MTRGSESTLLLRYARCPAQDLSKLSRLRCCLSAQPLRPTCFRNEPSSRWSSYSRLSLPRDQGPHYCSCASSSAESSSSQPHTELPLHTINMPMWRHSKPSARHGMSQRRTFLGLQQTPPPNPRVMGYLVFQGLAVVLMADLGFASLLGHPSVTRRIAQSTGIWKEEPSFENHHSTGSGN